MILMTSLWDKHEIIHDFTNPIKIRYSLSFLQNFLSFYSVIPLSPSFLCFPFRYCFSFVKEVIYLSTTWNKWRQKLSTIKYCAYIRNHSKNWNKTKRLSRTFSTMETVGFLVDAISLLEQIKIIIDDVKETLEYQ